MQQPDELVSVLIIRDNFLLDFHLLLQNCHLPVQVSQLWLKAPQLFVLAVLIRDLGFDFGIGLYLRIEIHVVIRHSDNQGRQDKNSQARCKRHFTKFSHIPTVPTYESEFFVMTWTALCPTGPSRRSAQT